MIKRRTLLRAGLTGGLMVVLTYMLHPIEFLRKLAINPPSKSPPTSILSIYTISQILWAAQGITRHPFRAAPSAGGTYPLELYVVVGTNVDGIKPGVYQYLPFDHNLHAIIKEDKREHLALAFDDELQPHIKQMPISLIITAIYERTTTKYGTRGDRYVQLEIGHVTQNVLLQATSLGLSTSCLPVYNEMLIKTILNIPDPLLFIPISNFVKKEIIETPKDLFEPKNPIPLPIVDSIEKMSVEEAIAQRRSIRTYSSGEISLEKFSKILWAAQGVINPETNTIALPSISKTFPVTIYAILGRVTGLKEGIYRYSPRSHALERVREGNFVPELVKAGLDQPWIQDAQVNFVISTDYQKAQENLGEFGERVAHFEVGQTAENIYLEAQVLGLGTVVIGAFHDSMVRSLLNLPPNQSPLYIIPLGLRTE